MKSLGFDTLLVEHLIAEYFDGDSALLAKRSGFSKQQIESWRNGSKKPRKSTIRWLLSTTIAPEFKVACEFSPIDVSQIKEVRKKLANVLGTHKNSTGIYAFYDSMCNVVYIGKASTEFLSEMYQQMRNELGVSFPKAIQKAPLYRRQVVRYVSAYKIPSVDHIDYPKHVEALVLRLSKPIGNKVLGKIEVSTRPEEDA